MRTSSTVRTVKCVKQLLIIVFVFSFSLTPVLAGEEEFNWNWYYFPPIVEHGLVIDYPDDLPSGQANDVNIRVKNLDTDETRTFNFHNNEGYWSGTVAFKVAEHPDWPGWVNYAYTWTQVAGTNYHWEGHVETPKEAPDPGLPPTEPETDPTNPEPSTDPAPEPDPVTPDPVLITNPVADPVEPSIPAGKTSTEVPASNYLINLVVVVILVTSVTIILARRNYRERR